MKKYLKYAVVILGTSSFAQASTIFCSIGDGKATSTPLEITAPVDKSPVASIDQVIGDYRVLAFWIPELGEVKIGVIEQTNLISASTLLRDSSGSLFVSKNGQSVDLNCTVK